MDPSKSDYSSDTIQTEQQAELLGRRTSHPKMSPFPTTFRSTQSSSHHTSSQSTNKRWSGKDLLILGIAVTILLLTALVSFKFSRVLSLQSSYFSSSTLQDGTSIFDREPFKDVKPYALPEQNAVLPLIDLRNAANHHGTCYKRAGYTTAKKGNCSELTLKSMVKAETLYDVQYLQQRQMALKGVNCGQPEFEAHEECRPVIVTYATQCSTPLNMYVEMAHKAGLDFKLLFLDQWGGFGHRVRMEHALVRTFHPRRLVVLTDALDVAVVPTCKPSVLQAKYNKVVELNNGTPFITAAERYIWPDNELRQHYKDREPPNAPSYCYINAGSIVSESWAILDVFESVYDTDCDDDQRALARAFLTDLSFVGTIDEIHSNLSRITSEPLGSPTHPVPLWKPQHPFITTTSPYHRLKFDRFTFPNPKAHLPPKKEASGITPYVAMDRYTHLIQALAGQELEGLHMEKGTNKSDVAEGLVFRNKETGNEPCFIHYNGNKEEIKMDIILSNLGMIELREDGRGWWEEEKKGGKKEEGGKKRLWSGSNLTSTLAALSALSAFSTVVAALNPGVIPWENKNQVFTGYITHYGSSDADRPPVPGYSPVTGLVGNYGACGFQASDVSPTHFAALNQNMFERYRPYAVSGYSGVCNLCLQISCTDATASTCQGRSTIVQVVDSCPGCSTRDKYTDSSVDISARAFEDLVGSAEAVQRIGLMEIQWTAVPCPASYGGPVQQQPPQEPEPQQPEPQQPEPQPQPPAAVVEEQQQQQQEAPAPAPDAQPIEEQVAEIQQEQQQQQEEQQKVEEQAPRIEEEQKVEEQPPKVEEQKEAPIVEQPKPSPPSSSPVDIVYIPSYNNAPAKKEGSKTTNTAAAAPSSTVKNAPSGGKEGGLTISASVKTMIPSSAMLVGLMSGVVTVVLRFI
ncbi:hypothetical protein HDV05_001205 [Chytridiales sp. JEL 0842]|nr:hypothetical protein HDV05_001205 [Chytridiales sp. JEL 0842]